MSGISMTSTTSLFNEHEDYIKYKKQWELVRDCCAGQREVQDKNIQYLPDPENPIKKFLTNQVYSTESRYSLLSDEYLFYLTRACFINYTGNSKNEAIGRIFANDPVVEVPSSWGWVDSDIDGAGNSLASHAMFVLDDVMQTGTGLLLADFPNSNSPISQAQVDSNEIHPFVSYYSAESVIDWNDAVINGKKVYTLFVLKEKLTSKENYNLDSECDYQYRVLSLDFNGVNISEIPPDEFEVVDPVYTMTIYRNDEIFYQVTPKKADGSNFKYIPAVPVGVEMNDIKPQKTFLADIAYANIYHYQTNADLAQMNFKIGQPTPKITGASQSFIDMHKTQKFKLGASTVLVLPEGADFNFAEVQSTNVLVEQINKIEDQLSMLGASMPQQSSGEATDTVRIRQSGKVAILTRMSKNFSSAYKLFLTYCADYLPGKTDTTQISSKFNTDFFLDAISPLMITALIGGVTAGVYSKDLVRTISRESNLFDPSITNQQIQDEIEIDSPVDQSVTPPPATFDLSSLIGKQTAEQSNPQNQAIPNAIE